MTNYIIFPIGDWSCDGHNCYADFLVKSEKTLDAVREAHLKENSFIGSLCKDYEDNKIEVQFLYEFLTEYINEVEAKNILQSFIESGIELSDENAQFNNLVKSAKLHSSNIEQEVKLNFNHIDGDNSQFFVIYTPEEMLNIWITILNVINPDLKLEIASEALSSYYIKYKGYPHEPSGNINFYGYDVQNRHLDTPGYGIWQDYEGEFYHPG